MTAKIFLNYRRTDADAWADRVFERLVRQFPRENVFMDIDGNIPFGFPWAKWLDDQVAACDLMLVLIGRTWVAEFQARSDPDERDFVRVEIESALARRIPVVPVFLGDAPVPKSADLPPSVRPLLSLQAARLQRLSFDSDAETLVSGVARSIALARGEVVAKPAVQRRPPTVSPPSLRLPAVSASVQPQAEARRGKFRAMVGLPGAEAERWLAPGDTVRDADFAPEMVLVPPGKFWMGSKDGQGRDNERPQHEVMIAYPLLVGKYPVTFDEWDAYVAKAAGSKPHNPDDQGWGRGRRPVINVSWHDAKAYADWLSKVTGKTYRLLTEAEWEYCCRAGTETAFSFGEMISTDQANYNGNYTYGSGNKGEYRKRTTEVGSFPANPFALHDMHGNVWEWCEDAWFESYVGAPSDGSARTNVDASVSRVLRGGSWFDVPQYLRSANRDRGRPGNRIIDHGFRLARTLPP
jgi:formylglycine-generating enzyme required for sulfatase activity